MPNRIKKIEREILEAVSNEIRSAALLVESTAKTSIQRSPATGRTYVSSTGISHTASSHPNPPRTDKGGLVSSINHRVSGKDAVVVGSNLDYAQYLEFGTVNMDSRPWLQPALKQNERTIINNITKAMKDVIKKYAKR